MKRTFTFRSVLPAFVLFVTVLQASTCLCHSADIYVDPIKGDDSFSGLSATKQKSAGPLRSIAVAIGKAVAGDVIHLAPVTFHEEVKFRDKAGAPGRPIVLDGHGAVISGTAPIEVPAWESLGNGLYRSGTFLFSEGILTHKGTASNEALIKRFFLLWNGEMNRMGRCSKGHCPPLPAPAELQPGQWTYVPAEEMFYLKIAPGRELATEKIEYPRVMNGLSIKGDTCTDLVIRNLTVTHVNNDGFNIKSAARSILFQDVTAIECGDDGISAHDTAKIEVNGFTARGNASGATHVGGSSSTNRRLYLVDNGANLILEGTGQHEVQDSVIGGHAGAIMLRSSSTPGVRLVLNNISIPAEVWPRTFQAPAAAEPLITLVGQGSTINARRVKVDGSLSLPQTLKPHFTESEAFDPSKLPVRP